ncbi:MAG: cbb3-type cytochrome c oxidase N-terminal domain-containing protein [Verrucomicrobiales bacterium]|nr:cbb3-type cytochrome c oxidase N-terminal domain-containing protein [Verrucomicrobiales bacterium]
MSKKSDSSDGIILRDHVYDGIEEYDQKLPNWWLFTLYITIVWFIFAWVAYYQMPLDMLSKPEKIDQQIAAIEAKKQAELEEMMASLTDESLVEMSQDESHIAAGEALFQTKCIACHGTDLSATMNGIALPGVPLNDAEWKYGAKPLEIMNIVTNGSPDITKGMIAWNTQLSPSEIAQVVSYILSKQPN